MPHVTFHGGPIIQQVHVVNVSWTNDPLASTLSQFYSDIVSSSYFDWLQEYDTSIPPQSIERGQVTTVVLSGAAPITVTDAQLQTAIQRLVSSGVLPAPDPNTLYAFHFPSSTSLTGPGGAHSCVDFCQYHSAFQLGGQGAYYLVVPGLGGCASCGSAPSELQNTTAAASHALLGAVTDPAPPIQAAAWSDDSGGEIGDLCSNQEATFAANGTAYTVQKQWSNASGACVLPGLASRVPALSPRSLGSLWMLLALVGCIVLRKAARTV